MAQLSGRFTALNVRLLAPLFALAMAASLTVAASGAAGAQRGDNYTLHLDERAVTALAERAGDRGIAAADFANWFGENARFGAERGVRGLSVPAQLSVMAVDGSGRLTAQAEVPVEISERGDVRLDRRGLERAFTQAFPSDTFFPTDTFHKHNPNVDFFPSDTFISSRRELDRVAATFGQRASREGYALFIAVVPAGERFDPPVSPGATAVAGRFD